MQTPLVQTPDARRLALALGASAVVAGAAAAVTSTAAFRSDSGILATAVTIDMALTGPLVYLFLARRQGRARLLAVPLFIAGTLLAGAILPDDRQATVKVLHTWVLPIVELGLLSLIGWRASRALRMFRRERQRTPDARAAFQRAAEDAVGVGFAANALASELALFYYALLAWGRVPLDEGNVFSVHRTSATRAILAAFVGAIAVETAAVHLLLHRWPIIAWISTLSGLYAMAMLVGYIRSLTRRPCTLEDDVLKIRCGIAGEVDVPLESIDQVECSDAPAGPADEAVKLGLLGTLEPHSVVLRLQRDVRVTRMYGILAPPTRVLQFHVDRPADLRDAIRSFGDESAN